MKDEEKKVEFIDDDEIITLYDENDNPVDFYEIAVVEYEDNFYALLQPAEEVEGIEEDEAIICKIDEQQDDDTDLLTPVNDEELLDKIFNEYLKAVAEEDECCCHDENCDCEHHHEHHEHESDCCKHGDGCNCKH